MKGTSFLRISAALLLVQIATQTGSAYGGPEASFFRRCVSSAFSALAPGNFIDGGATPSPEELELLQTRPELDFDLNALVAHPRSRASKRIYSAVIRALDIGYATVALPFATAYGGFFALMIRMESSGPVFFIAERVGMNGEVIKVPKLRTMIPDAPLGGSVTLPNDPRFTGKWGQRAARYKADEVPQLLAVLSGKMSIVGYRPTDVTEAKQIEARMPGWFALRHDGAKPGLADAATASLPHTGDVNTDQGLKDRKEKTYRELQNRSQMMTHPILTYHRNMLLILKAIIDGTGSPQHTSDSDQR